MAEKKPRIEHRACGSLRPDPENPRKPMTGVDRESLKRSLERWGMVDPVLVSGDLVVGGHQRLDVWTTDLGRTEIPVIDLGPLPDAERRALCVALNNIEGDWDYTKLSEVLRELRSVDQELFELTAFTSKELADLIGGADAKPFEDFSAEPVPGRAWLIVQGEEADVARLREALVTAGLGGARIEAVTE